MQRMEQESNLQSARALPLSRRPPRADGASPSQISGPWQRPVRDSNPLLHRDKVIRCPYANGADVFTAHCPLLLQGWSRESNPGRDVHSVACCHYTMTTVFHLIPARRVGLRPDRYAGLSLFLPLRKQEPRSRSRAGLRGWCSYAERQSPSYPVRRSRSLLLSSNSAARAS